MPLRDTILERFLPRETHFSVVEALKALPAILWGEEEAKPALATPGRALEAESLMDEPPFEANLAMTARRTYRSPPYARAATRLKAHPESPHNTGKAPLPVYAAPGGLRIESGFERCSDDR